MKFFSAFLIISVISVLFLPQVVSAKVTNPTFDMDGFWWLDDDASGTDVEDNTGFGAGNTAENTHITDLNKNSNVRLRINLEETANQTTGTNVQPRLEYQSGNVLCDAGGTWTTITTSSANAFQLVNSTTITDGNATDVDRVTDPAAKTHVANGELRDATNPATSVLIDNQSAEWEWNFIATTNAADSQIYTFRIVDALGTALVYNLPTVNDCPNATTAAPAADLSWDTGATDFEIWAGTTANDPAVLTWDNGTLICSTSLTDDNTRQSTCGSISKSQKYRIQTVLENIGGTAASMNGAADPVDQKNVKTFWAGTSPTLDTCGFNDLGADNGATTCTLAFSGNDVRITNTGAGNVIIAATTGTEGFMYLITTDSDVSLSDSSTFVNADIDSITEDSSLITIGLKRAPGLRIRGVAKIRGLVKFR